VITVMPKITAYVRTLRVDDNARVVAGELLVELDPRDYQNAVDSAEAQLHAAEAAEANAEAELAEQQTIIGQDAASIAGDMANLAFASEEYHRYTRLAHYSDAPVEQMQQTQANIGQRRADTAHDQALLDQARAHVAVLQATRAQAISMTTLRQAALNEAQLNLSYTWIRASSAGTIVNKTVEVGDFVEPGETLFSLVPNETYAIANYRETQIARMRPGDHVTITVDGFPQARLTGHVDSLQRGTGSLFALLPPDNATGNFVKVVQRVPVKIVFDDTDGVGDLLAPGMSVETKVFFRQPHRWLTWLP
jgi:membrane fusion protein, multidrug efflux system